MEEEVEEKTDVLKQMKTIETFEQRQIAHELALFTQDVAKMDLEIVGKPGQPPPAKPKSSRMSMMLNAQ